MDRIRLTLLVLCALLTTTLGSSGLTGAKPDVANSDATTLPSVSSAPVDSTEGLTNPSLASVVAVEPTPIDAADQAIVEQILERLAMRHTALPVRERRELVHTIVREARSHNLDPALVVAVIEVESAGYHLAVSHVGAMGLMQLLPSTGQELAERMDIEWKGDDTLFDPIINVRLGTAYLSQLAKRYDSVDTALAAYNWGPGRIDRRLRRGATVPSRYIEQVMRVFDRNAMTLVRQS